MSHCARVLTDLSAEEALAVVDPYFVALKERASAWGARRVSKVLLEIAPWAHDSPRHYAACSTTGSPIVAAPEIAELHEDPLVAILAHEIGHAVDYLYPGEYLLVDDGELVKMPAVPASDLGGRRGEQAYVARMRQWQGRDEDTIERTADAIAEHFMGVPIGYAGPCRLQSFERGERPRPRGLR
jgi:hypothetical protein